MKIEVSIPVVQCKEEKRRNISAYVDVDFRRRHYTGTIIEDESGWEKNIIWNEKPLSSGKNKAIFDLLEQTLRNKEVIVNNKANRRFYIGKQ